MANGSDTRGKAARPHAELLAEIMDSRIPKTEREHAAAREIERLTRERDELRHDIERALDNHAADLRERDELHAERDAMRADAVRYQYLTADLPLAQRMHRNELLMRMAVMSYSAASANINAALTEGAAGPREERPSGYLGDINGPGCDPDTP